MPSKLWASVVLLCILHTKIFHGMSGPFSVRRSSASVIPSGNYPVRFLKSQAKFTAFGKKGEAHGRRLSVATNGKELLANCCFGRSVDSS